MITSTINERIRKELKEIEIFSIHLSIIYSTKYRKNIIIDEVIEC